MQKSHVALYVRLSDEDREKRDEADESESIQNQKNMLIAYCVEHEWNIYDIYCDEDYSGADRNRPDWNRMIRDCESGKIDIVLCKTQSRFSRDMEVVERYIHGKFFEWNIRFISIVDHADTAVAGNKKARQINGLVNEWYLEDLSDNIRRTLLTKRKRGDCTASFAPYGYLKDPQNKNHLVIDPVASEVVKDIFRWAVSGIGYERTAQILNEKGVIPPGRYKCQQNKNYSCRINNVGEYWTPAAVYRILRNEVYIGVLAQGKTHHVSYKNKKIVPVPSDHWIRCPNTHEPIIDVDTWKRIKSIQKTRQRPDKTGEKHPLCGKVFCAVCHGLCSKLISHSTASPDGYYKYFRCKLSQVKSDQRCLNSKGIRVDELEEIVLSKINLLLEEYHNSNLIEDPQKTNRNGRIQALLTEQDTIKKNIKKKEDYCVKLYEDLLENTLSNDQFTLINTKFQAELCSYQTRLSLVEKEISLLTGTNETKADGKRLAEKYKHVDHLTYDIVNEFVASILVGPKEKNCPRVIEIQWNF